MGYFEVKEINTLITDNESQVSFLIDWLFCSFMHVVGEFYLPHLLFLCPHPCYPTSPYRCFSHAHTFLCCDLIFNWDYLLGHGFGAIHWSLTSASFGTSPKTGAGSPPESISGQISSTGRSRVPKAYPWSLIGYLQDSPHLVQAQCRNHSCCDTLLAMAVSYAEDTISHFFSISPNSYILKMPGFLL